MTITITHTPAEGTLVEGTSRGDGTADILKARRFRWGRSIGCWYLPHTRDQVADTWRIDQLAQALRAAGHTVDVSIDDTARRDVAEAEADRAERAEGRADMLEQRAARRTADGQAAYKSGKERLDRIPFGQPVLAGHHSEGRDRNYRAKAGAAIDRGFGLIREGERLEQRAQAATANQAHRQDPRVTQRRIERLAADERRLVRAGGEAGGRAGDQLAIVREQLAYWRGQLDQAVAEDSYRPWGPEHFVKGDLVLVLGTWREVVRVNKKSLSVASGYSWTNPAPYDRVAGRRRGDEELRRPPLPAQPDAGK